MAAPVATYAAILDGRHLWLAIEALSAGRGTLHLLEHESFDEQAGGGEGVSGV